MEERELVRAAQKGDQDAFAALVEIYRIKMFNLIYSLTRNRETADDLAQETFMKAYQALPRFKFKSEFGTWLYRIAVNTSRDHLRKSGRMKTTALEDDSPAVAYEDEELRRREEAGEDQKRRTILHQALQSLPEKYRAIITLRDIQGFPYGEIVEILNISPGTVDSRLHRARKMLRKKVSLLAKA